jgi:hypothetical protein
MSKTVRMIAIRLYLSDCSLIDASDWRVTLVEVRCAPLPADSEADEQTKKAVATVQGESKNLQFLSLGGKSVLSLREQADGEEANEKPKKKEERSDSGGSSHRPLRTNLREDLLQPVGSESLSFSGRLRYREPR